MIFNTYNLRLKPLIDELSREFHGVYSLARSNSSIDAKSIRDQVVGRGFVAAGATRRHESP